MPSGQKVEAEGQDGRNLCIVTFGVKIFREPEPAAPVARQGGMAVVVVGGGVAGAVAALTAAEEGSQVLLLERSARCGGSESAEAQSGIATLGGLLGAEGGAAGAWLARALGLELRPLPPELAGHAEPACACAPARPAPAEGAEGAAEAAGAWEPAGPAVAEALARAVEAAGSGVRVLCGARAVRLLAGHGGGCRGCVYVVDGEERVALGAVVLCTGGFGADFAPGSRLALHRPDLLHLPTGCGPHAVGSALALALPLGALAAGLEQVEVHPLGLVRADCPDAKAIPAAAEALLCAGGVLLDKDGDRFCAEASSELDHIARQMWKSRGPFRLLLNRAAAVEVACHCRRYVGQGLMRHFPSGAALARDMGVPLRKLEATLDAHHTDAAGAAGGGGALERWLLARSTPGDEVKAEPFLVAVVTPVISGCRGGLAVDGSCAVQAHGGGGAGEGVAGLFAAGEAAASTGAGGRGAGFPLLECVVQGRQAGRAAAAAASRRTEAGEGPDASQQAPGPSGQLRPHGDSVDSSPTPGLVVRLNGAHPSGAAPGVADVRLRSQLGELTRLLESRLTPAALQASLAKAHGGGGIEFAVEELKALLGPGAAAAAGGPSVTVSFRDRAHGLPTTVRSSPLPDEGACAELPLTCVHCRLPVTAEVLRGGALADAEAAPGQRGGALADAEADGSCAYATLLYGDKTEYPAACGSAGAAWSDLEGTGADFLGALVIGWSIKATGSTIDRLLLHTDDVPGPFRRVLERVWTLRHVQYLEGSSRLYKNYNQSRFKAVFTKLQALSCTDYSKVLMLDLDMLVRQNIDELFKLRAPAALKRSSGKEQPAHGGPFYASDLWRTSADDMCSGINAGVMLLQPDVRIYERMVAEIKDSRHPEHIGTYGPEQDYLSRFYATFLRGAWTHIHARFNYQLMLPDDYVSSAHRKVDLQRDVAITHYSGPRVKPWKSATDLDEEGVRRLLSDDSVLAAFGGEPGAPPSGSSGLGPSAVPEGVRELMWEWVLALRGCAEGLRAEGVDLLAVVAEAQRPSPKAPRPAAPPARAEPAG
ncbi:unnamed protein product [Prorocentrum cordatum]|uniref:FAD-dependent oxidoreductase 2 FAD-binding domain-containing protein n=1 Tax=Prorocentrum cordatum TaxID=2364126 RepID=A0ABN9QCH7_9DINO|nr:unnamed protein product [Polarella glacialis]